MVCCSGYILCDIPSHGDVTEEIFGNRPPLSPQQSSKSNAAAASATAAGAGGGGGTGSPKTKGTGNEGSGRSSTPLPTMSPPAAGASVADAESDVVVEGFQPTHVVYLDASLPYIVKQQGLRGAGAEGGGGAAGKEAEAKLRADLERYFAEEKHQQDSQPVMKGSREELRVGGSSGSQEAEQWIPATARALQERYEITAEVIDAEGVEEGEVSVSEMVRAVDQHLCGGEVPAFVWMLSGGNVGSVEEAGESSAEEKMERQANGGRGDIVGDEDGEGAGFSRVQHVSWQIQYV